MQKILIIKTSALDDIMIALPHIEKITENHRDDQVWILTGPQYAELFRNDPSLQVVVLDRRQKIAGNSTWARAAWIRKKRFSCIYDLQGNRTSRLLVRLSGAPKRVGTQPRAIYTHQPPDLYTRESGRNVFDRLNETLISGGLPPATPGCTVHLAENERRAVNSWKTGAGRTSMPFVLLHGGGSREWPSKRRPEERFARLAAMIETTGTRCVWVDGPEERELNQRLARQCGIDATSLFTPLQLCLLGQGAVCAITNDSGPMHILSTANIPVYSFFGPTDWRRSHGAGQAGRILTREVPCSPCFSRTCPAAKKHACLDTISPEEVFDRVARDMKLLQNSDGNRN